MKESKLKSTELKAKFYFQYPDSHFIFDVELKIPMNGISAIFGPSGSGKTTLLRCIAGLEQSPKGSLDFCGEIWQSEQFFLPVHQRSIGYVFQESSLFEHLSVIDNLNYGRKRVEQGVTESELNHLVHLFGLNELLLSKASELSGGERQRVAIVRALAMKPRVLLMDEPLASLDNKRKKEIMSYLEKLKSESQIPIIYVSHSIDEVARLADYLVLMEQGKLVAQGDIRTTASEYQVFQDVPQEPFSLLFGQVVNASNQYSLTEVDVNGLLFKIPKQEVGCGQQIRLHLYARDVSLTLQRPELSSIINIFKAEIKSIEDATEDGQCLVHLQINNELLLARISTFSCHQLALKVSQSVFAQIKAVSIIH
ncbi:molybdenum ABC transporter ATP-binding protein [Aliikangiella sp. IMCC44359]|uniref:molybdenum ABC transporter ATP-binding protein n=1 Tax=Aliikangiella sp. IMCC44359 TaxID=3459125 RepID=UPI00403AA205